MKALIERLEAAAEGPLRIDVDESQDVYQYRGAR